MHSTHGTLEGLEAMNGFDGALKATPSNYNLRMTPGRSIGLNTPFDLNTKMFASGGITPMLKSNILGVAQTPTYLGVNQGQTPGNTSMMKSLTASFSMTPSIGNTLFSPALSDIENFEGNSNGLFSPQLNAPKKSAIEKKRLDIEGELPEKSQVNTDDNDNNNANNNDNDLSTIAEESDDSRSTLSLSQDKEELKFTVANKELSVPMPVNRISLSQSTANYPSKGFASQSVKELNSNMPPPAATSTGNAPTMAKTPSLLSAITPSTSADFNRTRRESRRKSIGMKITDLMSPEEDGDGGGKKPKTKLLFLMLCARG